MRDNAPFQADDLAELDERLLSRAGAVVSCREAWGGHREYNTLQMRHDVDGYTPRAWEAAQAFAEWEHERGYHSTYYLLHTAEYWQGPSFVEAVRRLEELGHEVGLHNDALGAALEPGGDPYEIFRKALAELRDTGVTVTSTVAHGNRLCQSLEASNDELFTECLRKRRGGPRRAINGIRLRPVPLSTYGLDFEAARTLPWKRQLTDSAGRWPMETVDSAQDQLDVPSRTQMHVNLHPDWWTEALLPESLV